MSHVQAMRQAVIKRPEEGLCETVDRLPPHLRRLVHEFGFSIVTEFVNAGIVDPVKIRHLVRAVHLGAREPGNHAQPAASQARRLLNSLDVWLVQHGAGFPAVALVRGMREMGYAPFPFAAPSSEMVQASMGTVAGYDVRVTKEQKHFRRLQAALTAAERALSSEVNR